MKTSKYSLYFLISLLMLISYSGLLYGQAGQSSNYLMTGQAIIPLSVAPGSAVSSNSYQLQEALIEQMDCTVQQSNQYIHQPGLIFSDGSGLNYCTDNLYSTGCSGGDNVNDFVLGDISNLNSGCSEGGYGDFTNLTTDLTIGESYTLSIMSNFNNQHITIWIDWDDSFSFDLNEKVLFDFLLPQRDSNYTTEVLIPEDALQGMHRLRIRTRWNNTTGDPCATYVYGEAEDYMVNLQSPQSIYCTENLYTHGCSEGDGFTSFSLANIHNLNSGCSENGFGDFTEMTTDLERGETYLCLMTSGFQAQYMSLWIDLNNNGIFEADELQISNQYIPLANTNYGKLMPIALDAPLGEHRLRIRTNYMSSSNDPCAEYGYGETEDYTVNIVESQTIRHSIQLIAGWNGVSSYLAPDNFNITDIFESIGDELIIAQSMNGVYWPGQNVNTIHVWDYHNGYEIKVSEDVILNIDGDLIDPATVNVEQGWNLIPVFSSCNSSVETLCSPITDDVLMIKDVAGTGVYWPEFNINTLQYLEPGKSYHANFTNETVLNFVPCEKGAVPSKEIKNTETNVWEPAYKTPNSHTIMIEPGKLQELENGAILGAFTQLGQCAGALEIQGENTVLVIFGDDPLTDQKEGFVENETITLRVYQDGHLAHLEIEAEYDHNFPQSDGTFKAHGISAIHSLETKPNSILGSPEASAFIFPNPASDKVNIHTEMNMSLLNIFDLSGRMVFTKTIQHSKQVQLDIQNIPAGMYSIVIIGNEGISNQKFIKRN